MARKALARKFTKLRDAVAAADGIRNRYHTPATVTAGADVALDGGNLFAGGDLSVKLDKKSAVAPAVTGQTITITVGAVQCAAADVSALAIALNKLDWDFDDSPGRGENDISFHAQAAALDRLEVRTVAQGPSEEVTVLVASSNDFGFAGEEGAKATGSKSHSEWDDLQMQVLYGDGFWYVSGWELS
jgi:hypothetical protein